MEFSLGDFTLDRSPTKRSVDSSRIDRLWMVSVFKLKTYPFDGRALA
jgi:hypothetical protein